MKPATESALLKFMAVVTKAISEGGGSEVTPEDITPEMLDTDEFYRRLRLYGHTFEEVEQLIEDGKCIRAYSIDDNAISSEEDILYRIEGDFIDEDLNTITVEQLRSVDYLLYTGNITSCGLLLHKTNTDYFKSVNGMLSIKLLENYYTIHLGTDTL